MDWKAEWKALVLIVALFLAMFYLPVGKPRFDGAILESLQLVKWYAREHVLLCLVPAFYIAGAISVFVSHDSVMKYLGAKANEENRCLRRLGRSHGDCNWLDLWKRCLLIEGGMI